MEEPKLTVEQKIVLIDLFNNFLKRLDLVTFNKIQKVFLSNSFDFACFCRFMVCEKTIEFNGIKEKDCFKCWLNWFIKDHETFKEISNNNIKDCFSKIVKGEIDKRDNFGCYPLLLKAINAKSKQVFIDLFSKAIDYLK